MKQWVAVLFGALAGLAQAQSFDWNRVWSGCTAEANAFDADVRGTELSARKVQNFVQEAIGSPPTEARMRAKMAEDRAVLSNPQYDVTTKLATRLALCGTMAAQRQLQSGSTQSASVVSPRPSPPPPSSRAKGRNQPDKVAVHCMDEAGNGFMRNTCNQQVNVRWCSVSLGPNTCGSGYMAWADVPPGGTAAIAQDVKVQLIACAAPTRPTDIEYSSGSGFLYNCVD